MSTITTTASSTSYYYSTHISTIYSVSALSNCK